MDNQKIGNFISNMRKEKHLTQKELADNLCVTDKAVSKWERGICYPDITIIEKLCNELDISIIEIFKGEKLNNIDISDAYVNEILLDSIEYSKEIILKRRKKQKRILISLFFISIISIIIGSFLIDYIRFNNYKEPAFSIYTKTSMFNKDTIKEYYGLGYKVIRYHSKSGRNDMQFGTWFLKYKNINIDDDLVSQIKESFLNDDYKKEGRTCYNSIKILGTDDNEKTKNLYIYAWVLNKCFYTVDNELIKDSSYSIPHKITVEIIKGKYEIIKKEFIDMGEDYESRKKKLFPKTIIILIDNFHETDYFQELNDQIDLQISR